MTRSRNPFVTAGALYQRLINLETDASIAPDVRRWIRDERQALHVAIEHKDGARIAECVAESTRCLELWRDLLPEGR